MKRLLARNPDKMNTTLGFQRSGGETRLSSFLTASEQPSAPDFPGKEANRVSYLFLGLRKERSQISFDRLKMV